MPDDLIAGMDEEGLRRTLGELLAANRASQANFDEIRQQFPIQPSSVSNGIPTWEELEEGGLSPPNPEEGEGESFAEQLGGFADLVWIEASGEGAILRGGSGLTIEHTSTGHYKIWLQAGSEFDYPGSIRVVTPSTVGAQSVNANVNLITSGKGVLGWEIVIVSDVNSSTPIDASFHFSAANLSAE